MVSGPEWLPGPVVVPRLSSHNGSFLVQFHCVCGNSARTDLCGGRPERAVPTAI